jgi:hypothetical protein
MRDRTIWLFLAGLVAYGALLLLSIVILEANDLEDSPVRFAVALLPLPAATVVAGVTIARYRRLDELQQRIHLVALAVAFVGGLFGVFTWGFLEGVGVPRLSGFVWFGVLWILYVAGLVWGRVRYA